MGYRIAWFSIGQMYETGYNDLEKNLEKAVQYYIIAEEKGYYVATYHLAEMHELGIYYDCNMEKAIELYQKSAKMGYYPAKLRMLKLYMEGFYLPRDEKKIEELREDLCRISFVVLPKDYHDSED